MLTLTTVATSYTHCEGTHTNVCACTCEYVCVPTSMCACMHASVCVHAQADIQTDNVVNMVTVIHINFVKV